MATPRSGNRTGTPRRESAAAPQKPAQRNRCSGWPQRRSRYRKSMRGRTRADAGELGLGLSHQNALCLVLGRSPAATLSAEVEFGGFMAERPRFPVRYRIAYRNGVVGSQGFDVIEQFDPSG